MKKLILFFIVLVSFSTFAQDGNKGKYENVPAEMNATMYDLASRSGDFANSILSSKPTEMEYRRFSTAVLARAEYKDLIFELEYQVKAQDINAIDCEGGLEFLKTVDSLIKKGNNLYVIQKFTGGGYFITYYKSKHVVKPRW